MVQTSNAEHAALARRVAASPQLAASPRLQALFLYIMDCYLSNKPEATTEQQIGIHVFGRRPGYSSGDDSIVRSQARLLRAKLSAYFANEGLAEPVTIEIPKGHYLPVLHERESREGPPPAEPPPPAAMDIAAELPPSRRAWLRPRSRFLSAVAVLLLAGLVSGAWIESSTRIVSSSPTVVGKPDPLWALFMKGPRRTLVIYSNPLFFGDPYRGLSLTTPAGSRPEHTDETYTGTGEVAAIYALTRLFDGDAAMFTLKRSQLVTWDEARSSNLVFIGAPSQNTAAHELPPLSEFAIEVDAQHQGSIANRHPQGDEPARFPRGDATQETAIVALLPGLEPGARILIFSGLTTIGTQAAVEFACHAENAAMLWARNRDAEGEILPFEAVLRIGISKGVGVSAQVLAMHRH